MTGSLYEIPGLHITADQLKALGAGCSDFRRAGMIEHIRGCDTCTRTLLDPAHGFEAYTIRRVADLERYRRLADVPVTRPPRYTSFVECEFCDTEIFASRLGSERSPTWLNRLDRKPHNCSDFRENPVEVRSGTPFVYRRRPRG